jgi:membrane protein involved in colicin uptake
MTQEEKNAADKAAADKAKADQEAAEKALADKDAAEKEAAEKAKADKAKADKEAADKAKAEKEAAEKAAVEKAKTAKKKTPADLKSSDDVVIEFKNPVHVEEDGESSVKKEKIVQHVKYAFWQGLKKDDKGNPAYSTLRGAKLIGYVEDGKVIQF